METRVTEMAALLYELHLWLQTLIPDPCVFSAVTIESQIYPAGQRRDTPNDYHTTNRFTISCRRDWSPPMRYTVEAIRHPVLVVTAEASSHPGT